MKEQSGLFWGEGTNTPMTEQEVAGWHSPEQTGERLVETVTAWLAHALEQLPAEWQWFRIDFERPGWIDPRAPEHALHELQRLTAQLPRAIPEEPPLEREQRRAVEVLMATRDTVEAVQGLAPPRALVLIDNSLILGIAAARAHVEPWEVYAASGHKSYLAAKESHEMIHGTQEEKEKRWSELQSILNAVVAEHPAWSITQCRKDAAEKAGCSLRTIYRNTTAPKK
ncbi:hypothetical protein [Halomonas alkalisoli]|uniref:hypothetical protein n=1 Tax=Halomonas alkalisoli TaxID=2907158 RepID=UPI001F4318E0|nr:hypothetical protein [Halomonas alkalisoli]MCE9681946.1 hypothetical protein [Halomonas alkalisoli]